jgi:tetratricopeptide (TPR) repeat protein
MLFSMSSHSPKPQLAHRGEGSRSAGVSPAILPSRGSGVFRKVTACALAAICLVSADVATGGQTHPPKSQQQRLAADQALRSGDYATAITAFQALLKREPENIDCELGLANAFRGVHNFDEARRILELAHRQHPKSARPLEALGDMDLETQEYDRAFTHLRAALAINPRDAASRVRLAVAYKAKAEFPEALQQLQKVLALDPKNALAYYTRAQIEADRNDDKSALADAEKSLSLAPGNRESISLTGKLLVNLSRAARQDEAAADEAVRDCVRAAALLEPITNDSADSQLLYLLSHAYQCAKEDDKAQKTLADFESASQAERTRKDGQMQAKHLVEQANALAMNNDLQGSLGMLQQALATDPASGPAYSQLAKLYYSAGDLAKASDAVTHALEIDPYQPDFLYVQGKILEKEHKLEAALESFQRATLVNPKESDAFFEMGAIYLQQHDRPRALAAYKRAVALSPDDPDYARALAALSAQQ